MPALIDSKLLVEVDAHIPKCHKLLQFWQVWRKVSIRSSIMAAKEQCFRETFADHSVALILGQQQSYKACAEHWETRSSHIPVLFKQKPPTSMKTLCLLRTSNKH